ncbi:NADP-dependent oxidoreductase [Pseudarthrobacter sp. NPDC058196]|uniref:NADP-dependent oxidoreductase n=1 Tax=Pseudarthrobacter sp. NPDC058196 TaxID=3346376 RepID=UPI0036D786E8
MESTMINAARQWRLKSHPHGLPVAENFELVTEAVREPRDGEVVMRLHYVSIDPGLRLFMNPTSHSEWEDRNEEGGRAVLVGEGEPIKAWGVGEVIASRSQRFPIGTFVRDIAATASVQEYACLHEDELLAVQADVAPLPAHLGILGMTGLTAYFGMIKVAKPRAGDTVVVSGAAGAVGSIAVQIAKMMGCRVVGIAGGPLKCTWLRDELGVDVAIDYKARNLGAALREACPDGMDIYFDNVGGEMLDTCLANLAQRARIVSCGAIAEYNRTGAPYALANWFAIMSKLATWTAFNYFDYLPQSSEGIAALTEWLQQGLIKAPERIVEGIENFPAAMVMPFSGDHVGKLMLKVV